MKHLENRYNVFLKDDNTFGVSLCKTFLNLLDKQYSSVLEVGPGKGFFTYLFLKEKKTKSSQFYGTDTFDDCQKDEIGEITESFYFKKTNDGDKLPFPDNYFDLIFSIDVIEHVFDDKKFLAEQIRTLKPGGEIILGTPNYHRIANLLLRLLGRLKYPRKLGIDNYGDIVHLREYKKRQLIELLNLFKNKIENIEITPVWLGISFLKLGYVIPPKFMEGLCHFWFVKFKKTNIKK